LLKAVTWDECPSFYHNNLRFYYTNLSYTRNFLMEKGAGGEAQMEKQKENEKQNLK
jgi:hypothetical protein